MKIKKYTTFIKESTSDKSVDSLSVVELLLKRSELWELISELTGEDFDINYSFSDVCKTDNDPEDDFNKIQSYFDSKGFTLDYIKEIFSEESNRRCKYNLEDFYKGMISSNYGFSSADLIDKIRSNQNSELQSTYNQCLNPFERREHLLTICATVDIYFYKLFEKLGLEKNIVGLGGYDWCNWKTGESDEAFIRYRYGYHTTKYGQLMIQQSGMTEEEFKEDALSYLQEYIQWNTDSIILTAFLIKSNIKPNSSLVDYSYIRDINITNYSIIEEDRYIIDLIHLCEDINNIPTKDGDKLGNKYKLEPDDIATAFAKDLSDLKIEIVFTGSDLLIYSKFNENL